MPQYPGRRGLRAQDPADHPGPGGQPIKGVRRDGGEQSVVLSPGEQPAAGQGVSGHDGSAARDLARSWLLTGGEDHGLLATVPADAFDRLPAGARVIGRVLSPQSSPDQVPERRPGVLLAGQPAQEHTGWDHFSHT